VFEGMYLSSACLNIGVFEPLFLLVVAVIN